MTVLGLDSEPHDVVTLHHRSLHTTFKGVRHKASTPDIEIQQYRGVKYANIPVRFRRSVILDEYPPVTDATRHG
jgi:carboxylesterase type B